MGGTPSRDLATKSFPMQPSMRSLDARQVWPPCVAAAASRVRMCQGPLPVAFTS